MAVSSGSVCARHGRAAGGRVYRTNVVVVWSSGDTWSAACYNIATAYSGSGGGSVGGLVCKIPVRPRLVYQYFSTHVDCGTHPICSNHYHWCISSHERSVAI